MSRVAKKPVNLPEGVTVTVDAGSVTVKGAKGTLSLPLAEGVLVEQVDKAINVKLAEGAAVQAAKAGSTRAHLANMVEGVANGYVKELEIQGVGYRCAAQGKNLELALGYSHAVKYDAPEGIEFEVPQPTQIIVRGIDKQRVGQVAAEIRKLRPPEPYKGKGIRYAGEHVARKVGKRA